MAMGGAVLAMVATVLGSAASARTEAAYPPELLQRHLVSIGGGRHLNIFCTGKGSPTVVFEQALAAISCTGRISSALS